MFSLLQYAFDSWTPPRKTEKVLFLGLDGAGKTTLIDTVKSLGSGFLDVAQRKNQPTVGLNVSHTEIRGKSLTLLEVGGGESIRSIWNHYYHEATKIIFVVDGSDAARFGESQRALTGVLENIMHLDIQILLVSNKMDALGPEEADIVRKSIAGFAPHGSCKTDFCPCSGIDHESISAVIEWILK